MRAQGAEYIIFAGIVFVVLTVPYLESNFGSDRGSCAPSRLREKVHHNLKKDKDHPSFSPISSVAFAPDFQGAEDLL